MALGISAECVSALLESLLQAAADPARWPSFIEALNTTLGAEKGSLLRHRFSADTLFHSTQSVQLFQAGFDPEGVQLYNQQYGKDDPYARGFRVRHIQRPVGLCFDLVDHDAMRRGAFYNEFAQRFDIFYLCWIAFTNPGEHTALSLVRSEKREPFGESELQLLNLLAPHLRQAISLNRKLELAQMRASIGEKTAEAFAASVIALDANGHVISVSITANRLLAKQDGIRLRRGKLALDSHTEHSHFESMLEGVLRTAKGQIFEHVRLASCGGGLLVTRRKQNAPLQLTLFPFHSDALLQDDRPCALVFLCDPETDPATCKEHLRELYGLTLAESKLAELIGAGVELQAAADRLNITKETARDRLKQIFRKTGVGRQPELVRLVSRLPKIDP